MRANPVGPQDPARPAGGFHGFSSHGGPQEVLSDLERRERESQRLVEEAKRQAETIQRDAYRAGFEQGERAGEKLAFQKIEPVLQAFNDLVEAITIERQMLIQQHESELIKVAFAIAMQVIKTEIRLEPEVVAGVVEAALEKVAGPVPATIYVSPHDRTLIELQMKKLKGEAWPPAHIRIEVDETVGRGGCRVATEQGNIDATIETQLRAIKGMLWSD